MRQFDTGLQGFLAKIEPRLHDASMQYPQHEGPPDFGKLLKAVRTMERFTKRLSKSFEIMLAIECSSKGLEGRQVDDLVGSLSDSVAEIPSSVQDLLASFQNLLGMFLESILKSISPAADLSPILDTLVLDFATVSSRS